MKSHKMPVALGAVFCLLLALLLRPSRIDSLTAGEIGAGEDLRSSHLESAPVGRNFVAAPAPSHAIRRGYHQKRRNPQEPLWMALDRLEPEERANARIEIELPRHPSQAALRHARATEDAWNKGQCDRALQLFRSLGALVDLGEVEMGISWREPIRSGGVDWGDDVQVSARDSVYQVALDIHIGTDHLFVALLYPEAGNWCWSVNLSSDGGETWAETYQREVSWQMRDIDATVLTDYFYVGYTGTSSQNQARVMRFLTADGSRDPGYPIQTVYSGTPYVRDLALCSNADYYNNRIYCAIILDDSTLQAWWADDAATAWSQFGSSPANADRGLDVCTNENFADYSLWASYISLLDNVEVAAVSDSDGNWYSRGTMGYSGPAYWTIWSSIGAWGDTVITVFEREGASNTWVKYAITHDAGSNWMQGFWGDTLQYGWAPNVTSRRGFGMGGVFQQGDVLNPEDGLFTWGGYSMEGWIAPVDLADHGTDLFYRPAIEWIQTGVCGVVYINYPEGHAYFDRTDWVGVEEEVDARCQMPDARLSQNHPNPFGVGGTTISFNVKRSTLNVSLKVYDLAGRLVRTLVDEAKGPGYYTVSWDGRDDGGREVAGGVYFYGLKAGQSASVRKMVVLR